MRTMPALILCALVASVAWGQTDPPSDLRFEVASIKPNNSDADGIGGAAFSIRGRYSRTNVPLDVFVARDAFGFGQMSRVIGLPEWTRSSRFDIVAKTPRETTTGPQELMMLQALLAERFKMVAHRETREIPVYALQLVRADGRLGPNLHLSQINCASADSDTLAALRAASPTRVVCAWTIYAGKFIASSERVQLLVPQLSARVDRPIVNQTGLSALFDWELEWPDPNAEPGAAPSIFTTLREQLGLKLEPTRAAVGVVVIDHIERPTPD